MDSHEFIVPVDFERQVIYLESMTYQDWEQRGKLEYPNCEPVELWAVSKYDAYQDFIWRSVDMNLGNDK